MTIYPDIVRSLLEDCGRYRRREWTLDALKSAIWGATEQIISLEDRELRRYLQQTEAELDEMQFTLDSETLFDETLKVVERLEAILETCLKNYGVS